MKKLLRSLAVALFPLFFGLLLAAPSVGAFSLFPTDCPDGAAVCADKDSGNTAQDPISGKNGLILKVSRIIAVVAGIAAVIMIVVGGFRMITSGGDSDKAAGGRKTVLYSLVGLVVIVLAETIITFVVGSL